jgi:PAS domain S-box-containing protein
MLAREIMNTRYQAIYPHDSIKKAIEAFRSSKLDTLPVIDEDGIVIGVLPRHNLYDALLKGNSLEDTCRPYVVSPPSTLRTDFLYDQAIFEERVNRSRVSTLPVIDEDGRLAGMLGKLEYLRASLHQTVKLNALLQSILQGMDIGIITIDTSARIIIFNDAAESMFGVTPEEVQGMHISELFPELQDYDFILRTGKRRLGKKYVLKSVPVIVNMIPICENGVITGVNMAFFDVTELEYIAHQLENVKSLQETLSTVLNAAYDGVFITDKQGIIQYANDRMAKFVGSTPCDIVGKPIQEFLPDTGLVQAAETGVAVVSDVQRIQGRSCIVSHTPVIKDGKSVAAVATIYFMDNKINEELARKLLSLKHQVRYYREELEKDERQQHDFNKIITNNPEMKRLKREARRVAASISTILLTGESGVGKDMFARAIHAASPRRRRPFVKVNCAAIPESLLESELFGYAPGSFTGALKGGKPGRFEQAHEGTIFLDEIGDMPLSIQAKLLQVLQEKQFMRVGGTRMQEVDVRIIAATNRDLREAMANNLFREDLYYRLNVIEFYIPALRERPEDYMLLVEAFIEKYNSILGTKVTGISAEAEKALRQYSWPGNVRELENAIERAANFAWEGEIGIEHLPRHIAHPQIIVEEKDNYRAKLNRVEKEIIIDALKKTNGNKSAAARMLNLSRSAFYEKLARYDIQ